jgi:hypothetical protein
MNPAIATEIDDPAGVEPLLPCSAPKSNYSLFCFSPILRLTFQYSQLATNGVPIPF